MKKTAIIISVFLLGTVFYVRAQEMTQKEKNSYSIGVLLGKKVTEEIQNSGMDLSLIQSIKEKLEGLFDFKSLGEGLHDILNGECKLAKEEIEAALVELQKEKGYLEQILKKNQDSGSESKAEKTNYLLVLAQTNTNLSWYYLFIQDYTQSEQAARKALELDSTYLLSKTNLAHALLFQNRFSEAEAIYKELSQTIYKGDETYTQALLKDFDELENEDAIPEKCKADVEKIRKMLRE